MKHSDLSNFETVKFVTNVELVNWLRFLMLVSLLYYSI